jgi:flagellar hook assembly protein FlgD
VLTLTNYPNPFRPGEPTKFAYYLDTQSSVTIKIFDLTGRLIRVICDGVPKAPGSHEEDFWDGSGSSGRECLAGTYIVRSEFKSASGSKQTLSRKITLIK